MALASDGDKTMLHKSAILIIIMAACAANWGAERTVDIILKPTNASSTTNTKPLAASELKALRREVAQKKRRIVFHSDGMSMNEEHRYLEKNPCVFPYIPGSQTDACTYSLIHQFPVARLYRSDVAQEWPPGIIEKLYGDGPDDLETYIEFCRKNNYEAFWAMRMNDTHDAGDGEHGRRRWNSNKWKQAHPEYLVGVRNAKPPYGRWSAFDYAHPEVREKAFRVLEEVCRNYDIDGLLLDFFRHLPTFKTTANGGEATAEEVKMMNCLFRRIRQMADEIGAARGRPILIAARTPDSPGYSRALGLDVEQWMKRDLIDIWITTGYFRLQEWRETAAIGHKHGTQVWASIDESRVAGRGKQNSLEAYRSRIMNAWNAGVDAIWLFNFFYLPKDPQFQLLFEAGDPKTLKFTDKMYVVEARGQDDARKYLKTAERFITRPRAFTPENPFILKADQPQTVSLLVGDDVASAKTHGRRADLTLRIQAVLAGGKDDLIVRFNDRLLTNGAASNDWVEYDLDPRIVRKGPNQIVIARGARGDQNPVLRDLLLWIRYHRTD
jgi:hypothetical protein